MALPKPISPDEDPHSSADADSSSALYLLWTTKQLVKGLALVPDSMETPEGWLRGPTNQL